MAQFRAWKSNTRKEVVAASGRDQEAYIWIKMVEDPTKTLADFQYIEPEWQALAGKLNSRREGYGQPGSWH